MKKMHVVEMSMCALFAALTAVLSQILFPIGPVPINLALISVYMAGALLGAKYGTVSQVVYVLMGAIGLPVFASFSGGPGVIAGKSGGFIIGYVVCAFLVGFAADRWGRSPKVLIPAMAAGTLLTYFLGIIWFMVVTNIPLVESLGYCVFPFLPGDAVKIAISATLAGLLHPALQKIKTR